jgi:hypothetical protein
MRRILVNVIVLAFVLTLAMSTIALAHEGIEGKAYGLHLHEHTHTQSANDVTLYLPEPAENGVHGDFHQ